MRWRPSSASAWSSTTLFQTSERETTRGILRFHLNQVSWQLQFITDRPGDSQSEREGISALRAPRFREQNIRHQWKNYGSSQHAW